MRTCGNWKGGDLAKFNRLSKSLDLALSLWSWHATSWKKKGKEGLGDGEGASIFLVSICSVTADRESRESWSHE